MALQPSGSISEPQLSVCKGRGQKQRFEVAPRNPVIPGVNGAQGPGKPSKVRCVSGLSMVAASNLYPRIPMLGSARTRHRREMGLETSPLRLRGGPPVPVLRRRLSSLGTPALPGAGAKFGSRCVSVCLITACIYPTTRTVCRPAPFLVVRMNE